MPSAQTMLSAAASVAASIVMVRSLANDLLPGDIQDLLYSTFYSIFHRFSSQLTVIIDEFNGFSTNKLYTAAQIYLGSIVSASTTRQLRVSKDDSEKDFSISMERGETVVDIFQGVKLEWQFIRHENQKNVQHSYDGFNTIVNKSHSFYLGFHKKHKEKVLRSYLPHVLDRSKALTEENKALKLHTVDCESMYMYGDRSSPWVSVNLNHPATFSTIAMDAEAKQAVMDDLERFVKRKEFYRRVGKAWKRGYLLYGPPGTGKSSLIAAMANFLKFDVYDLELTDVKRNSDLRRILISTENRSILVIEDIDCTVDFKDRNDAAEEASDQKGKSNRHEDNKITLSGLLNFIDGLWSSCGDERIIVFTTNHKEKLDPALLRPGRMDMHIHMSYCCFGGFQTLAKNYHTVEDHPFFEEIKQLMMEVEVTPAQVAEELMKSDDPDTAFRGFIEFLKKKKVEDREAKSKEEIESEEKGQADHETNNQAQKGPNK